MNTMDILEKIFGSAAKVKIMRLFLFHPNDVFDADDISTRAKVQRSNIRKELAALEKIDLIRRRSFVKEAKSKRARGKVVFSKKKTQGWTLNNKFRYIRPLQNFLIDMAPLRHGDIIQKFKGVGNVKLLVISGVFIQEFESRVDLLVVGDHLKKGSVENAIKALEAEVGRELVYAMFATDDFRYRYGMYDKLIRDVLDYPHEVVIDKLGLERR